ARAEARLSGRSTFDLRARLDQADGIAQFRGALVALALDGTLHFALHHLKFRKRPLRAHFLAPFFKKSDLRTLRFQLRKSRLLEKLADPVATLFDLADGVAKLAVGEQDRDSRPGVHHQDVGTELFETPNQILPLTMFVDEGEEVEIALCIANHAFEFVDLKEAQKT